MDTLKEVIDKVLWPVHIESGRKDESERVITQLCEAIEAWNKRTSEWVSADTPPKESGSYLVDGFIEGDSIIIEADYNAHRNKWTVELYQSYDPHYEEFTVNVKAYMSLPPKGDE